MCKCIYCNSDNLSVSDLISYALTGAKLRRKSVCHEHNKFTNDNFEKVAIANLDFFRNSLGLSERKGGEIKYKANVTIDGITIPNISVSGRKSIYDEKKRLFPVEQNGSKFLVGNVEKLKQKNDVVTENIKLLDMSDVVVSVTFSIDKLFASDEMLHTIAKIAYEWFCAVNEINAFIPEYYQEIVDSILMKKSINDVVDIVVDGNLYHALKDICHLGSHGLFEYVDTDGYRYVIYGFWGIVYYKIRICNTGTPNTDVCNCYNLYLYNLDGDTAQTVFGTMGKAHFVSMTAHEAIKQYHKVFLRKLEQLIKTTVLSLRKTKQLADELQKALLTYKQPPHDFARLIDYEDNERIMVIRLLLFLLEHEDKYIFDKSYNENLKQLLNIDDLLIVNVEENKTYAKHLLELHEKDVLGNSIEGGLSLFDKIYTNEQIK